MEMIARHICAWCGKDQGITSRVDWPEGMPVPARGVVNDVMCATCEVAARADLISQGILVLEVQS